MFTTPSLRTKYLSLYYRQVGKASAGFSYVELPQSPNYKQAAELYQVHSSPFLHHNIIFKTRILRKEKPGFLRFLQSVLQGKTGTQLRLKLLHNVRFWACVILTPQMSRKYSLFLFFFPPGLASVAHLMLLDPAMFSGRDREHWLNILLEKKTWLLSL